jgi:hypothetical protein
MAKPIFKPNARAQQVLEDLDRYLEFCRDFGYRYDEVDLYNNRSYAFQQYKKFESGKEPRNMWIQDAGRTFYRAR